ncbi:non-specific lipid-transfer protein 2-like [Diospyros lotus]|uniref:non-specific lipid-transfer protein 2-like n=1 Tax=Diospyros lotus TaxID=55363 RepID=UPI00225425E0|nr:non-specific lipid-transfer protein 2-like [Diospyros lotus]
MKATAIVAVVSMVVLVLGYEAEVGMAVTCNPVELSPCVNAMTSPAPPTQLCCTKVKLQKSCLCQYVKNPTLRKFVNSPNSKKVSKICRVPFPRC